MVQGWDAENRSLRRKEKFKVPLTGSLKHSLLKNMQMLKGLNAAI